MRKALVIGINDYAKPELKLNGCVNDASNISMLLKKHSDGSPNFHVKELIHLPKETGKSGVKREIEQLFSGNPDVALFYFAGHGCLNSYGGYLAMPNASEYDEGISMEEILTVANKSNARNKIIILDCCHSGKMGSPQVTEGLSTLADGVTVLTACRPTETATEVNGQGVFTSLLIDALHGGCADLAGHISPGSIYAYVDRALGPWESRPVFKTNVSSFVSLRNVSPPISTNTLRNITKYFTSPKEDYPLDPSYEFTESEAIGTNVATFKDLQKMESVGLVKPVDAEHMYFAAINSKACKLTAMGLQYWKLVASGNI